MHKGRLEAFSDGVLAIVISFVTVAIYWNNHHHMLQAAQRVSGGALWANLHVLFWLSLVPFVTDWMGEHFAPLPVAAYGVVLLAAGVAYFVPSRALLRAHGPGSLLARAIGRDAKGVASVLIYLAAVGVAFLRPAIALGLYWVVALIWLVPDGRIETLLAAERPGGHGGAAE